MKKQVLVIDSSKAIRFLLQTVLGDHCRVIAASDVFSGMFWLSKKNLPDLIIVDPYVDGVYQWDLVEQLTSSGLYGDIPVMVLSSLSMEETRVKCDELGVSNFFLKPFNPLDLLKSVNVVLAKKKLVVENRFISI